MYVFRGSEWTIVSDKLQTDRDVYLPKNLGIGGRTTAESPVEIEGGVEMRGSDIYFRIMVAGKHDREDPLPDAFENTLIFETYALDNPNNMEIAFWDHENARPSLVLNQGAPGRASIFERSLLVGAQKGIKDLDGGYSLCNDFFNLSCDTTNYGADFGVENDVEIKGNLFVDEVNESTLDVGVTIEGVLLKDRALFLEDGDFNISDGFLLLNDCDIVLGDGNVTLQDGDVILNRLAGSGERFLKVNDNGKIIAV